MQIGKKIYHFRELDSTNEFAKTLINKVEEGTVIIADRQKQGKGRFGKIWYSPEEGLWFSIILKPQNALMFPLAAGLAVYETLKALGLNVHLKWPNDILIGSKKIAGILTELEDKTVILGIGLNLNIHEFPKEIKEYATSLFLETGTTFTKDEILKLFFKEIEKKYEELEKGNSQELLDEWRKSSTTIGKLVKVKTPKGILQGKAINIDEDGALLLERDSCPTSGRRAGSIERVLAGECSLIEE